MKSIMKQYPVGSFFVLAYAISWVLWVPLVLYIKFVLPADQEPGGLMLLMLLGTFAPTVAAIMMTGILEGKPGVKKLLAKLLIWRVGFRWWLAAFLLVPVATFAAIGIYVLLGGTVGRFDPSQWYVVLLGPVFALPFYVGEEMGWRGYALPKLQQKYTALWSSVIVGALWALWHAPAYWASEGTVISGKPVTLFAVGWYIIFLIGISIQMTWVYNNSKGSLLLMVLFHGMFTGPNVFPLFPDISSNALDQIIKLAPIPVWIMAILIIARYGAARLSRQPVNQEPGVRPQRM
jgi:membrane protease YdiL (CAAX protease family)